MFPTTTARSIPELGKYGVMEGSASTPPAIPPADGGPPVALDEGAVAGVGCESRAASVTPVEPTLSATAPLKGAEAVPVSLPLCGIGLPGVPGVGTISPGSWSGMTARSDGAQ